MYAYLLWDESDYPEGMPDEYKWNIIRTYRGTLLTQSDWTQLGDAPFTTEQKDAWTAYRQALRDLPQDYANANDVFFPEKPA
jgi:hypothetical protein